MMKEALTCAFLVLFLGSTTAQCHRLSTLSGKKHNPKDNAGGSCPVAVRNIGSAVDACDAAVHAIPDACKVWDKNVTFNHCWKSIKSAGSSIEEVKTDVSIALDNCAGALLCMNALHEVSDAADLTDAAEDTAIGACAVPEPVEPELCASAVGALIVSVGHLAVKVADAVEKCTATPVPVTPAPPRGHYSVDVYADAGCGGGIDKSFTLEVDQCYSQPYAPKDASITFSAPVNATFTITEWHPSTTCSGTPAGEFNMATDVCVQSRTKYRWSA